MTVIETGIELAEKFGFDPKAAELKEDSTLLPRRDQVLQVSKAVYALLLTSETFGYDRSTTASAIAVALLAEDTGLGLK